MNFKRYIFIVIVTIISLLFLDISLKLLEPPKYLQTPEKVITVNYRAALLFVSFIFGALTGVPSLINRWHKPINFDFRKFIIQGIPIIIFLFPYIYFVTFLVVAEMTAVNTGPIPMSYLSYVPMYEYKVFNTLIIAWLGRLLIDCIKCKDRNSNKCASNQTK